MKKNNLLHLYAILSLLASLLFLTGCTKVNGDGPVVSESRSVNRFSGIHYALQGNLHITTGIDNDVEISAQRNIINVIEAFVSNNILFIRLRNNTVIRSYEPIDIYVKCKDPHTIQLSGSGNIWVMEPISPQNLTIESSGSGLIQLKSIQTDALHASISGSGKIEVTNGTTNTEKIMISGSGHILLSGVLADSAVSKTSGSGNIDLWVNQYLQCEISGSGIVRYKGSPSVIKRISGSGEVIPW